jgi:hypothetical protein
VLAIEIGAKLLVLRSRGQHVSNAARGAEQDEHDNDSPCDLEGARRKRNGRGGRGDGRGPNAVIGRAGQTPVARYSSASVLAIKKKSYLKAAQRRPFVSINSLSG